MSDLPPEIKSAITNAMSETEMCSGEGALLALTPCARHCSVCEGLDHHWMVDFDEERDGEPVMVCKHCPAWREVTDEDDEAMEA